MALATVTHHSCQVGTKKPDDRHQHCEAWSPAGTPPQGRPVAALSSGPDGAPSLAIAVLGGGGDGMDASCLAFLMRHAVLQWEEEEKRRKAVEEEQEKENVKLRKGHEEATKPTVTLWMRLDGKVRHQVEATRTQPLRTVLQAYCRRSGIQALRVLFFHGELLSPDDSPDQLVLEDDHIIEVEVSRGKRGRGGGEG